MGHARAAPNAIGDELLRLLPRDGGSIPNRAALAMHLRQSEAVEE